MKIKNHLLYYDNGAQVDFKPTPNKGKTYTPLYLVIHFTADTNPKSTINWFQNPKAQASAHILIDRDGNVTQFCPLNNVAWHAGVSRYAGISGLNSHSIGIELTNAGRVIRVGDKYKCAVDGGAVTDVVIAQHKNEDKTTAWQAYTDKQLKALVEVGVAIHDYYKIKEVIGHDDIAPGRKTDPGPAFPMSSIASKIMGRKEDTTDIMSTTANLNMRAGGSTGFRVLKVLPKGTEVQVLQRQGNWGEVAIVGDCLDKGWVSLDYLT